MKNEMQIRLANRNDIDVLLSLTTETYQFHRNTIKGVFSDVGTMYSYEQLQSWLENDDKLIIVAEQKDLGCVGYVIGEKKNTSKISTFLEKRILYIKDLGITGKMRGKGFGTSLLDWIEKWACHNYIDEIQLSVWSENEQAIDFYLNQHFEESRRTYIKRVSRKV